MQKEAFIASLSWYLPPAALEYCYQLWSQYPFQLKISKARASKLGDYRYLPAGKKHVITINNNLNPYNFLVTYIHEIAHLVTFCRYSRNIAPHGKEWKSTFRNLLLPVLNEQVFPQDLLIILKKHMQNPKASSCSDNLLLQQMRKYDPAKDSVLLGELHFGQQFMFRERIFEKKNLKRTRVMCREIKSNRNYLISKFAEVKKIEPETMH